MDSWIVLLVAVKPTRTLRRSALCEPRAQGLWLPGDLGVAGSAAQPGPAASSPSDDTIQLLLRGPQARSRRIPCCSWTGGGRRRRWNCTSAVAVRLAVGGEAADAGADTVAPLNVAEACSSGTVVQGAGGGPAEAATPGMELVTKGVAITCKGVCTGEGGGGATIPGAGETLPFAAKACTCAAGGPQKMDCEGNVALATTTGVRLLDAADTLGEIDAVEQLQHAVSTSRWSSKTRTTRSPGKSRTCVRLPPAGGSLKVSTTDGCPNASSTSGNRENNRSAYGRSHAGRSPGGVATPDEH